METEKLTGKGGPGRGQGRKKALKPREKTRCVQISRALFERIKTIKALKGGATMGGIIEGGFDPKNITHD